MIRKNESMNKEEAIKKFFWLIQSGLTIIEASKLIKQQSSLVSVHNYVDNYLREEGVK